MYTEAAQEAESLVARLRKAKETATAAKAALDDKLAKKLAREKELEEACKRHREEKDKKKGQT